MTPVKRNPWRDAALCVSFANLCLVGSWNGIFRMLSTNLREVDDAWLPEAMTRPASEAARAAFGAVLCNAFLLSAVFFLAMKLLRRMGNRKLTIAARCVFLFLFMSPVDYLGWKIAQEGMTQIPFGLLRAIWTFLLLIPLIAMVQLAIYNRDFLFRAIRGVTLILLPMFPLNVGRITWALRQSGDPVPLARAGKLPSGKSGHVIWVIFDELDYRLAFEKRPATVKMPEFDRLRSESLFAIQATPPAYSTAPSMASILTGRTVKSADSTRPDPMLLFTDGETSSLSQHRTMFHQARQEGFNTAIVGYFLPYCSILGPALSECAQPSNDDLWSRSFRDHVRDQWQRELNRNWLLVRVDSKARYRMPWFGWGTRTEQRNAYLYIERMAREVATDRDMGLILIHWPIPHLLGIYNRHTSQLTYDQPSNYLDNLALADRTLGELRNWLDKAGLWDETTLVVSADHPLRAKAWMKMSSWTKEEAALSENKTYPCIPFIVKTAHNSRGLEYREKFDTILTNRLLMGLLEGKLKGVDDVASWLDTHRKEAQILLPE